MTVLTAICCGSAMAAGKPLKVYILAGQSNMQGSAHRRTFAAIGDDPKTAAILGDILDQHGELTAQEQSTWDRCASNAEYHYLGSGKTFVRFGKALAEAMLKMEKK